MLAKVPLHATEDPALATLSFTVVFDPSSSPPTNQFTILDADGLAHNNLFEIAEPTTISITLEGATFSATDLNQGIDNGINWVLKPSCAGTITVAGNTRIFDVSAPTHVLHPWSFGIVVDTPDVKNIRSQNIFLAKSPNLLADGSFQETLQLKYDADNGAFNLLDGSSDAGILLGSQTLLVKAIPPGEEFVLDVALELLSQSSTPPTITFAGTPVIWSSGTAPSWITIPSPEDPTSMTISIGTSGAGNFAGFQFAIQITSGGQTTTILSPDPILINATIGDG